MHTADDLTDQEVDFLLEQFDRTEPGLQRRIIAAFVLARMVAEDEAKRLREENARLRMALRGMWEWQANNVAELVPDGLSDDVRRLLLAERLDSEVTR